MIITSSLSLSPFQVRDTVRPINVMVITADSKMVHSLLSLCGEGCWSADMTIPRRHCQWGESSRVRARAVASLYLHQARSSVSANDVSKIKEPRDTTLNRASGDSVGDSVLDRAFTVALSSSYMMSPIQHSVVFMFCNVSCRWIIFPRRGNC